MSQPTTSSLNPFSILLPYVERGGPKGKVSGSRLPKITTAFWGDVDENSISADFFTDSAFKCAKYLSIFQAEN
jgi:hypothetical protein